MCIRDGPKYNTQVTVTCSCGNTFVTGSTVTAITTELCSKCHPFYTGEQRIVDTANLVSKFEDRRKQAAQRVITKREKMARRKQAKADRLTAKAGSGQTLKDLLKNMSK